MGVPGEKGEQGPEASLYLFTSTFLKVSCGNKRVEISQIRTEASTVSLTVPSPACCSGVQTERPLICKVSTAPNIISGSWRLQGGKSGKARFRGGFECAAAAGGANLVNPMSLSVRENKGSNFKQNQESRAGRL